MRARRVLDAMLFALLRLEFLLLARRELRSFVCTFVCEVHGASEKLECRRACSSLQLAVGNELPRGDAEKDRGTPSESSVPDSHGSLGVVTHKVLKTIYTIHI